MTKNHFFKNSHVKFSATDHRGLEITQWLKKYFLSSWNRDNLAAHGCLSKQFNEADDGSPGYFIDIFYTVFPGNGKKIVWKTRIEILEFGTSSLRFEVTGSMRKKLGADLFKINYRMDLENEVDILRATKSCEILMAGLSS